MTAVQAVFSDLQEMHPQLFNVYTTEGKEFINHFHKFLEMEKQQIFESYCQGCFDITQDEDIFPRETAEDYYNETFNPERNEEL